MVFIKNVCFFDPGLIFDIFSKIGQHTSFVFLKIDLGGVWMDPYGSVWVRMVPGDLFQGLPGPNPLKIIEKYGFGFFWGWGRGGDPLPWALPSSLRGILTYLALRPAYGMNVWGPTL